MSLADDAGRSGNGSAERHAERRSQGIAHSYPLLVHDHGLATALRLLIKTLPYALARWGVLLASAAACVVWIGIADGAPSVYTAPWTTVAAGLAISLVVMSLNAVADGLRDALDPHEEGGAT